MSSTMREPVRALAQIQSAERMLQRTETAGRLPTTANADTLMRHLARMTRLAKWYRESYYSLLAFEEEVGYE